MSITNRVVQIHYAINPDFWGTRRWLGSRRRSYIFQSCGMTWNILILAIFENVRGNPVFPMCAIPRWWRARSMHLVAAFFFVDMHVTSMHMQARRLFSIAIVGFTPDFSIWSHHFTTRPLDVMWFSVVLFIFTISLCRLTIRHIPPKNEINYIYIYIYQLHFYKEKYMQILVH